MRIVAGLLAMLLVVSCSDKDKVPSGIIPRDKMETVLWDMIQADQYSALYLLKDSARINVKTETQKLYEEVFRLHQISREDFRKSFQYYQEHPDLTRSVFDSLLARGNRQRTESYSRPVLNPKPPPPPPSLPPTLKPGMRGAQVIQGVTPIQRGSPVRGATPGALVPGSSPTRSVTPVRGRTSTPVPGALKPTGMLHQPTGMAPKQAGTTMPARSPLTSTNSAVTHKLTRADTTRAPK